MAGSDSCDTPAAGESAAIPHEDIVATLQGLLQDLQDAAKLEPGDLLVVGASSSEVVGRRIGTSTSMQVGEVIVNTVLSFAQTLGINVAFQCCEHLNRALVVERTVVKKRQFTEVSAIPVPGAGGAVAATAFAKFQDACLVERVVADAGMDIGDTFIGMHLRHVAVPVRGRVYTLGQAHVTMARTRPPLIGGSRAVYDLETAQQRLGH